MSEVKNNGSKALKEVTVSDEVYKIMRGQLIECMKRNRRLNSTNEDVLCPAVFDGYLCWGPARANSTITQSCPPHVIGYDEGLMASKECLPNGSWWRHPESDQEWSNYTTCINHSYYQSRQLINDIYFYGYCLSLFTLIVSLIIFTSFRTLRCTRIRIHTQLFISLALSCVLWIFWYKLVVESNDVISENPSWCVTLHILTQYLMICNYFWMFCEGVHLHLVLVVVFIKDNVAMRIFIFIGWILPLIHVIIYSVMRSRNLEDSKFCWIGESLYMWILIVPVLVVLFCSTVFLVNIVRVLMMKLHPKSATPAPLAIKKAVRATLILIPLFGLQHVLLPLRPDEDSPLEFYYQLLSAILVSLQGFCVSILFCFANHEVISAVSSHLHNLCPRLFMSYHRESHYAAAATTTRDIAI